MTDPWDWYNYLQKTHHLPFKNPANVGKYTSPMDPIWWFQPEKSARQIGSFPLRVKIKKYLKPPLSRSITPVTFIYKAIYRAP